MNEFIQKKYVNFEVFITQALDHASGQKSNVLIDQIQKKKKHIDQLELMFKKADKGKDGILCKEEFRTYIESPCVQSYFHFLGVDYEGWSAEDLFELMDV